MADGILNPIEQLEAEIDFDVYTKQEVDALLDEKADKSDTYTKTETDALLDDKADADSVYTKTETDTLLSAKADKSTTLAGYGITDAYSKTQTDNLLNGKADADSVYTKTEIDTKIPNTVGSATKPTYVNGGVITECTYELNKTVPANAVFTDTTYTAGNGLNLIGTSFSAKAGANVSVDSGGINVNGNGVVASADSGLVSGGTAYTELRPTLDGTWVKNAQTTAINLQKLEGGIEYLYGLLSHQYDQLKKYINGNYYDYDTDTDSKYTKTVPQGAMPYASLEQIGGKTLVWNQLSNQYEDSGSSPAGVVWTKNNDGTYTAVADEPTTSSSYRSTTPVMTGLTGHKILIMGCPANDGTNKYMIYDGYSNGATSGDYGYGKIYTAGANVQIRCFVASGATVDIVFTPQVFDLTLMFGSGNEPTTVEEFQQMFPAQYYPYNAGTLLSAGVTEVVSKKADTTTIATYSIPAEVQALEGYGWSAGSVFNYIDYERKVFVKCVDKIVLDGTQNPTLTNWRPLTNSVGWAYSVSFPPNAKKPSANTTLPNILTNRLPTVRYAGANNIYSTDAPAVSLSDSTIYGLFVRVADTSLTNNTAINNYLSANPLTVYYELETPIETDISAYITDDNLISVEAGGSLTFPNSNGDDYRIDVPSSETYMVDLQASL